MPTKDNTARLEAKILQNLLATPPKPRGTKEQAATPKKRGRPPKKKG